MPTMTNAPTETRKSDFADLEFDYLYDCWKSSVNRNDHTLSRKLYRELSVRPEWSAFNARQLHMGQPS